MYVISAIKRFINVALLKRKKVKVFLDTVISNSDFDGDNYIGHRSVFDSCKMSNMSYISNNCFFYRTKIGKYCSIGPNTRIIAGEHPTSKIVSTCPAFFDKEHPMIKCYVNSNKFEEYRYTDLNKKWLCEIGNDVWIASNAMIVEGNKIGDGAIVCAGALVTKDVPPYAVVAGIPARIMKYRFTDDQIEYLKKLKWWDKDESWIEENAELFEDIDKIMRLVDCDGNR